MDFLKLTFYGQKYKVSPKGYIDCAIHLGNTTETPVGIIFEVKTPTNASEMITKDNLNKKALQELLLYYLRERVEKKNIQLKQLVVTNIYEFFIFDAQEFEQVFYSNKKLLQRFDEFNNGILTSDKTDFFYKEIATEVIESVKDTLSYTWFDIRKYKALLNKGADKHLIELYKIFSPEHLLKRRFQTDSNSLNTKFYSELLYIIGLEEIEETDSNKRIITRRSTVNRHSASILENTITILDSEDWIDNIQEKYSFGKDREEQIFNVALALVIGWINRILFLKLLEAQLVKYHKGDTSYAFLRSQFIPDYDELNKLFFQVLAKRHEDRTNTINNKFGKIPYLNSSLFEVSALERQTIRISSLDNSELPIYSGTVLKDGQKPRYKQLTTLRYLLEFLDAYDFASEGSEEIQETSKTLINASVLGLIFEKINGHKDGSVFTPGAVTMYMSREVIQETVVRKFNEEMDWNCTDYEALKDKDIDNYQRANTIVDSIRICDPAVGSGHFLVSVLNEIIRTKYDLGILLDCNGKRVKKQDWSIEIENDELIVSDSEGEPFVYIPGNDESQRIQEALFNEKRRIIENCLFGVDLNPNAVNICRLRLWIELLKNAYYTKDSEYTDLETLPNIDINIKVGNSLIHRFDLKQDISEILKKTDISISKYKDAVNRYKNTHSKEEKRELEDMISTIKSTLRTQISMHDPKLIRRIQMERELNKLLAPQLFEISKKEQMLQAKQVKVLKDKIDKLNDEINTIKNNKMFIGAFEWRIEFPEILDDTGRFVGFDCIIGNPPYIPLQKMGINADALQKMDYKTYKRKGDIYCLFYEMGMELLQPNAILSFITSNKWMKADYGQSLRNHISSNYDPIQLIDFANNKIFDSATVLVNILSIAKRKNRGKTIACLVEDNFDITKLSDYVETHTVRSTFSSNDSWSILSGIGKSIKNKVEAVGVPLKDWGIQINYGVKTGCNDAFIINSAKRNEILNNCTTEEERKNTAELIRPILRGRDIRKYGYEWADLWIINTHNGIKGELERIHIEDYPAIKQHLDNYWDKMKPRADQGDTVYNLRNCAYLVV
ncbi:MAG: Eco57I restriction-modification methylase domain-containing protein [Bacteroides heparinolyticus]|nr:Eco57I restriction-modification methylase domain-containing protein [Bacteroides heparinolyticus]MCI6212070.1 Eco57I restriction-modification methylase domain-containing protein [Bacteroides heparinolyticus]